MLPAMLFIEQLMATVTSSQSPAANVLTALGALVGVHVLLRFLTTSKKNAHFVYPASSLPFLGSVLDMAIYHRERLYDWITDESVAADGKPWIQAVPGVPPNVMICTPELFEDVLKNQFDKFERGDMDYFQDLFGKGILASTGDDWVFHRKTASHLFSNQMMKDVMYEAMREKVQVLCKALRIYESRGEPVSFKNVIMHFTTDVFGKIGFGVDLNSLEYGLEGAKGNEFVEAFATSTQVIFFRFLQPKWLWKTMKYLNMGTERTNSESREVIDKFIFRVINESIAKKEQAALGQASEDASVPPRDLISLFFNTTIKDEENVKGMAFDSEMHLVRDAVVSFIFAGKDTTSHTMSYFVVMMNRYPEVLKKIRDELRTKLPRTYGGEFEVPSMDDLPQLTYLEAAIRENLRLNPAAPLSGRQATEDVVLCDGTPLEKGARVTLSIYASGRMKAIWGQDALEFKPERWVDQETGKLLAVSPFKFMVFLAGRRNCIGMKFAMMEMKCALAVLLSQFDFQTVEDPWQITYETALTMTVKGPLLVKISSLVDESSAPAESA